MEFGSGSAVNATTTDVSESTVCGDYETLGLKVAAILRASVGSFSAFCCLAVIAVIVLYKKYRFFTQRQILYLAIAACVHSLSYPLSRVNYYTARPILDPYCQFGGFFNLYTSWSEVLSICCITFNLLANTVLGIERPWKFEYAYIVVIFFAPMLWTWIPFVQHAFGTAGAWCDIRILNEDCTDFTFGSILRFVLWYVPVYTTLIVIFVCTVVVVLRIRKDTRKFEGKFDPEAKARKERLISEVKSLLWYPIVYLLLSTFSIVNRIVDTANPDSQVIALWYLHVLTSNFRGAFISLVYAFDPETRKLLKCRNLAAACQSCCCKGEDEVKEYDTFYSTYTDSFSINDYSVSGVYSPVNDSNSAD